MALQPGTRLGPYEIVAPLGAGGMGEVYRATDSQLKRSVAIKVLPASMAGDADRLARFQREAEVLAALNHPNIAAIYGLEKFQEKTSGIFSAGARAEKIPDVFSCALVMELVEGQDLSELIGTSEAGPSGPADTPGLKTRPPSRIALTDALAIAKQIADALEAAHESGIVHRDLKPQNIKVRADGTVKVLDFGLAKAMDPDASGASAMNSPTMTARATQMGMILGTAAYMAPEQAKGKAVDRRADIWAFGVVLHEMLAGRRLFEAEDVSETLAAVLTRDVSLPALPAHVPPRLRALLRDCLIRDPKQRLRDIGDARLVLERIIAGTPDDAAVGSATSPAIVVAAWRRTLPWAVTAMLGLALIAALVVWSPWRSTPTPTPRKLLTSIGADASLDVDRGASAILSPDGTTLAFTARQGGQAQLFVRKLEELLAAPLAGTEGANYPFFSPNSQWIGFFAGGKLKKVSVTGGAAVTLCDAESGRGGTWADDDTIIFSPSSGMNVTLLRVPAAGGTPMVFGTLSEGAAVQRWPDVLPGGKAVLYTEHPAAAGFDGANIVVAPVSADPSAKAERATVVVRQAYYGRYVPSGLGRRSLGEGGHLIYIQQGTLFAVPFDPVRLETRGPAVPAIDGLMSSASSGGAQVAFSAEGTLVYVPGEVTSNLSNPIDWLARDGKVTVLRPTKAEWANPRFSPDGQRLALDISDGKQRDIWIYDPARDTLTQLSFDPGSDTFPIWTPDGRRIVFTSDRAKFGGPGNLYWVNADGTGAVTRLTEASVDQRALSVHPSGNFIAFAAGGTARQDLQILPMDGDATRGWTPGKPTVFLTTPANEFGPMFSPDGRFIAYFSNEAGGYDVYVRPFPGPGGPWRISTDGGIYPRWSSTTSELLYLNGRTVMVAPFTVVGDSFRVDKPQVWSPTNIREMGTFSPYDLHPDGKRVAAVAVKDQTVIQDKIVLMSNFFDYLRKIAPVKK